MQEGPESEADRRCIACKGGPFERTGTKGQGTAEGRGELRRWKARVPAAATVGAGSNAGPHLIPASACHAGPARVRQDPAAAPSPAARWREVDTVDTVLSKNSGPRNTPSSPARIGRNVADLLGFAIHAVTLPQSRGCRTAHYK